MPEDERQRFANAVFAAHKDKKHRATWLARVSTVTLFAAVPIAVSAYASYCAWAWGLIP